jgi:cysteine-rich repeat protein
MVVRKLSWISLLGLSTGCSLLSLVDRLGGGDGAPPAGDCQGGCFAGELISSFGGEPFFSLSYSLATGDLNGDGLLDAAAIYAQDSQLPPALRVLFGTGDGRFNVLALPNPAGDNLSALAIGDVDADGDPDLITSLFGDPAGYVGVVRNTGAGFGPLERFAASTPDEFLWVSSLAPGDFDNDGDLDIAVGLGGPVRVLLNEGGSFVRGPTSYASYAYQMRAGDMNGDGLLDIVTADLNDSLEVLLNVGGGSLSYAGRFYGVTMPQDLALGDLDSDGDLDVVTPDTQAPEIALFRNDGQGQLGAPEKLPLGGDQTNDALPVTLGDFNGDGLLDIAVAHLYLYKISVLFNAGGGQFSLPKALSSAYGSLRLEAGDFNGDGLDDIASSAYGVGIFLSVPCDEACPASLCGDGLLDPGEACDDGNLYPNDGCSSACTAEGSGSCGDGVLDPGEQCDDGNWEDWDGCTSSCTYAYCGDGVVNNLNEECDDGGYTGPGDSCTPSCTLDLGSCGDGLLDFNEQCDDGNWDDGDGCSSWCSLEGFGYCGDGFVDPGLGEQCDDGNWTDGDGCSSWCALEHGCGACGDGVLDPYTEECDDGNLSFGDGCRPDCLYEYCGDGLLGLGEECDDGNTGDSDGCSSACLVEPACGACGDGILGANEECDDGNTLDGDGCSALCLVEWPGYCGDGFVDPGMGEQCDDGNWDDGDGCSSFCTLEGAGYDWQPFNFHFGPTQTPCIGARYVRFSAEYGRYVGLSLCSPERYKIYLGDSLQGTFYQLGDYAGHGQDHCELVNPAFTIPNEDDVTSGCPSCAVGDMTNPVGTKGYSRAVFGEAFSFEGSWPQYNLYSVSWYECGVSIQ